MAIVRIEHLPVLLSRLVQLLRTVGREHRVDDVQRVLHAIVRNGGVALRQIPHGNAVDAQNVVGGVFGDVFLNARLMRDLGEIRGAEVLVDLHEHRVHRIRGRLIEVDIPVIGVQRVRHLRGGSRRRFKRQAELPLKMVLKFTPSCAAPSKPNGFMVEPGSNVACVALLSCLVR